MSKRGRAIGEEFAESELQTMALNESLARDQRRREIAAEIAEESYGSDDVDVLPGKWILEDREPRIESVDGGYWVEARVWVEADVVEERMSEHPRLSRLRRYIAYHGEGANAMELDLQDVARFLLVQTSPSDNDPWYVLLDSPEEGVQYIKQDYPPWDFQDFIDLDTDEHYKLKTEYSLEKGEE